MRQWLAHVALRLIVAETDKTICFASNLDGWEWLHSDNTIYVNSEPQGLPERLVALLGELERGAR